MLCMVDHSGVSPVHFQAEIRLPVEAFNFLLRLSLHYNNFMDHNNMNCIKILEKRDDWTT